MTATKNALNGTGLATYLSGFQPGSGPAGPTGATGATGPAGTILARQYEPTTEVDYTTSSTTPVDVDATNLVWPNVTAPASGNILLEADLPLLIYADVRITCNVREGAANISGSLQNMIYSAAATQLRVHYSFIITGLTSGTNHTYKLGWSSGGGRLQVDGGAVWGAAFFKATYL